MLDDDDFDHAWISWPVGGGKWITLLGLALLVFIGIMVMENREECASKKCTHGSPVLMNHECLCVERPVPTDGGQ